MNNKKCILIVVKDVEENPASDYAEVLINNGYWVEYVAAGGDPVPLIRQFCPIAVCFQFDYPDVLGLADMRLTKQLLPSVPLLMVTRAHSEQLAIWAFRTRVWDYFVQPVDTSRLLEVIGTLKNIRQGLPGDGAAAARTSLDMINAIPPEARLRCSGNREEQSIIERTLNYLDANLHKKIVQSEVANLFGLTTFQFSRLFKRLTLVTFQAYLLTRRIDEAKRLLSNPKVSITDVCFTVGFQDLSYFTRIFQRYVGLPPSRYRLVLLAVPPFTQKAPLYPDCGSKSRLSGEKYELLTESTLAEKLVLVTS